jgi:hypothetical protein
MPRLTFKKASLAPRLKAEGKQGPDTLIKLDGKAVGRIVSPSPVTGRAKWLVRFCVTPKSFKGVGSGGMALEAPRLFDTEPEARQWFRDNLDEMLSRYKFTEMETA